MYSSYESVPLWLYVLIAAGGIVLSFAVPKLKKYRNKRLEKIARQYNLTVNTDSEKTAHEEFPGDFFLLGSHLDYALSGEYNGFFCKLAAFSFFVGRGNSGTVFYCGVKVKGENIPSFGLVPEESYHKLKKDDIDFIDLPQFSKRYYLHGKDAAAVRKAFTRETINFFMRRWGNTGKEYVKVQCDGNWMIFEPVGCNITFELYSKFLRQITSFARILADSASA